MKKIITLTGLGGSGKSTICNLLSEKLNYKSYVMGDIFRKLADERGMDILEFNKFAKTTDEFDLLVDKMIVDIAQNEENIIFSSRTAWHFVPEAFNVYLYGDVEVLAKRIFEDSVRINEKRYSNIQEAIDTLIMRRDLEIERYKKIYGIDIDNKENYDLALDTTNLTREEVLDVIYNKYIEWLKGN